MPDSPPQAIHGLLSASRGRDAASAIRCRGFFIGSRSADACVETSRVLAAGGRDKSAMDGARPSQDRKACRGKSGQRTTGQDEPKESAGKKGCGARKRRKEEKKS